MTETEIQHILYNYFRGLGYDDPWYPAHKNENGADLVAYHPGLHHLWIIEAKSSVKLSPGDRTGNTGRHMALGEALKQICQRRPEICKPKIKEEPLLPEDIITYGLALPEEFRSVCRTLRPGVRSALSLALLFMQPDTLSPVIIGPHSEDF